MQWMDKQSGVFLFFASWSEELYTNFWYDKLPLYMDAFSCYFLVSLSKTIYMKPLKFSSFCKLFFCLLLVSCFSVSFAQVGKYFNLNGTTCKNSKVFIDHRIQQYCGTEFTVDWSGTCKEGFAHGNGTLIITSKKPDRSFTMTYEGTLSKGKKEGKGVLKLSLHSSPDYFWMAPYSYYSGSFKNDEFDGYGEFRSDYPYPIEPADFGKGVSMERLGLDLLIWRSDLFFYEYKGNFINGKIADTENGTGKSKKWKLVGKRAEYTGAVKKGIPNGKGFAGELDVTNYPPIRANGYERISYTGFFVDGQLNGLGKQVGGYFEYEGEFVNGIREGNGKMTHYEVNFSNLTRQLSSIIEGPFKNGNANGFCTVYFQNSAAFKYTGPMKEGNLEGTGEIEYLDGSKLRGNFKKGVMEGEGAIVFANGDKFNGIYSNDKPIKGTLHYYNGSKYEGGMGIREEKNKITGKPVQVYIRQGSGTRTDKDGRKYNVTCDNDNCTEQ